MNNTIKREKMAPKLEDKLNTIEHSKNNNLPILNIIQ